MKLYADTPVRRSAQVAGDVLLLVWVAVWVRTAFVVRDATLALGRPGEQLADAGTSMSERLRQAGDAVGGLPFVGGDVATPFAQAGGAASELAVVGRAQTEAVQALAFWLGLAVGAIPVLLAIGVYLPSRWRFAREASASQQYVDSGADLDLFALRAMARQPLHQLARISEDPVAAWRSGDPVVVRRLALLELRDTGLLPPHPDKAP